MVSAKPPRLSTKGCVSESGPTPPVGAHLMRHAGTRSGCDIFKLGGPTTTQADSQGDGLAVGFSQQPTCGTISKHVIMPNRTFNWRKRSCRHLRPSGRRCELPFTRRRWINRQGFVVEDLRRYTFLPQNSAFLIRPDWARRAIGPDWFVTAGFRLGPGWVDRQFLGSAPFTLGVCAAGRDRQWLLLFFGGPFFVLGAWAPCRECRPTRSEIRLLNRPLSDFCDRARSQQNIRHCWQASSSAHPTNTNTPPPIAGRFCYWCSRRWSEVWGRNAKKSEQPGRRSGTPAQRMRLPPPHPNPPPPPIPPRLCSL